MRREKRKDFIRLKVRDLGGQAYGALSGKGENEAL